jgi:hypothetical protein
MALDLPKDVNRAIVERKGSLEQTKHGKKLSEASSQKPFTAPG